MELNDFHQSPNGASTAYYEQLMALTNAMNDIAFRLERIECSLHINTTPSAAGPKVAGIAELLEHILLHLPMRDLLLAQRVSRMFKEVIDNSDTIQRALFFVPELPPTPLLETDVRVNPLLADEKSYISIPLYQTERNLDIEPAFIERAGWNLQKLRAVKCEVSTSTEYSRTIPINSVRVGITLGRLPGTACKDRVEAVGQSVHGSWRRMYLTQPPLNTWWTMDTRYNSGTFYEYDRPQKLGELWSWKIRRSDGTYVDTEDSGM